MSTILSFTLNKYYAFKNIRFDHIKHLHLETYITVQNKMVKWSQSVI